jgi:hypothetical protein
MRFEENFLDIGNTIYFYKQSSCEFDNRTFNTVVLSLIDAIHALLISEFGSCWENHSGYLTPTIRSMGWFSKSINDLKLLTIQNVPEVDELLSVNYVVLWF